MTDLDKSPAQPYDIVTEGPTVGPVRNYNPAVAGSPGGSPGNIQFNNAGSFGGLTDIQVTARIQTFTSSLSGAVPASPGGTTQFLRADGSFTIPVPDGNKGDITTSGGGTVWTINNLAVTYAKMQNVAANNVLLGNIAGASQPVAELTGTQATTILAQFSTATTAKGVVPGSNNLNLTTAFLRADGTWQVPPGGGTGAPPGGLTNTVQYNAGGGNFGGMSGSSWDDTNRALTMTGATVTTSHPVFNRTQTWNAAVVFDFDLSNITDTSSAIGSTIDRRQVNSVDKWVVRKDGTLVTGLIPAISGGTGLVSYTIGDILVANSTTTLVQLSDIATGNALITGGAGVAPSYGKIGLSTHVTGNLPVGNLNSGTGASGTTFWRGDGTWAAPSIGPLAVNTYTANQTLTTANNLVLVDTTAGNVTITLPAPNLTPAVPFYIKKKSTDGNLLTVNVVFAGNIDFFADVFGSAPGFTVIVVSDGSSQYWRLN